MASKEVKLELGGVVASSGPGGGMVVGVGGQG